MHADALAAALCRAVLAAGSLALALQTCLTDPGMLPRLEPSEVYLHGTLPR